MINRIAKLLGVSFICVCAVLCGCTKSSTSDDTNSGGGNSQEITLDCGVVYKGKVKNPVILETGVHVRVQQIISGNALIVQEIDAPGRTLLIKLQGVASTPTATSDAAMNRISSLTGGAVYFVQAQDDCTTTVSGGGQALVGQLITSTSISVSEELIKAGLTDVETNDVCSGSLIGSCLQALFESEPQTAGPLSAFLWKPESDSDGKLAVHTGPYDTTVIVNGEVGQNQGPGNGYGSLARFSKSGCGYPSPKIQVLSSGGLPYTVGGKTTFSVPSPCGRHCLENDAIVACSK